MFKEITIIGGAGHVGLAFGLICTSKNIKVHYNTNGTHYVQDAIDNIWPNFKTVELAFSIDDIGEKFEYQRYGANWNEVNQNITNYHKLASESWFASQVCMTFSAFNILSVGNLLEWVDTQPFGHVYFNLMHDPKHFNMKVLPDVVKEKIATNAATIKFDNTSFDFGIIETGASVSHTFKFTNTAHYIM